MNVNLATVTHSKAVCYYCGSYVKNLEKEFDNNLLRASKHNKNPIVFCGIRCFRAYLDKNRPNIAIQEPKSQQQIYNRILARRLEIERQMQFLPQNSSRFLILEEIFFELHTILEGRREITSHIAKPIQVMEV